MKYTRRFTFVLFALLMLAALPAQAQQFPSLIGTTIQRFERGLLFWRADQGSITMLADTGLAVTFRNSEYARLPDNPVRETPPPGFLRPVFGFGKVWGNNPWVRAQLGWAVGSETAFLMRTITIDGVLYHELDDGRVIAISNNNWRTIDQFPVSDDQPQARINSFDVNPQQARLGETVTVSWDISGVDAVMVRVTDVLNNETIQLFENVPLRGSVPVTIDRPSGPSIRVEGITYTGGGNYTVDIQSQDVRIAILPADDSFRTDATYQPYERGFMIWRADTGEITAFFNNGQVTRFALSQYGPLPNNPLRPIPGFIWPIFGFGKVWGNYSFVREGLGVPTGSEQGYTARITHNSPRGTMRITLPDGRVVTILGTNWQI